MLDKHAERSTVSPASEDLSFLFPISQLFLGNAFSQLVVGTQRPEAPSPRDLTSLLEPCLKNAAHLTAVVGKMQDFNWFWLQNSDHIFPWRCALQETILPKPGSFYTAEVNQVPWSFVMGKRERAFEHLITIFCNCWMTSDITKCSWWPAAWCTSVWESKNEVIVGTFSLL